MCYVIIFVKRGDEPVWFKMFMIQIGISKNIFFKPSLSLFDSCFKFLFPRFEAFWSVDYALRPSWENDKKVARRGGFARRLVQVV